MPKLCKCGRIVDKHCTVCYPESHDLSTAQRGYDQRWRVLSERKRALDPLCEHCLGKGKTTPAVHVHHIVSIRNAPHLRLNWDNLMSVCVACHDELEQGTVGG